MSGFLSRTFHEYTFMSGRGESNSVIYFPKVAYYRYTTARLFSHPTRFIRFVAGSGLWRVHREPEAIPECRPLAILLPNRYWPHTTRLSGRPGVFSPRADSRLDHTGPPYR